MRKTFALPVFSVPRKPCPLLCSWLRLILFGVTWVMESAWADSPSRYQQLELQRYNQAQQFDLKIRQRQSESLHHFAAPDQRQALQRQHDRQQSEQGRLQAFEQSQLLSRPATPLQQAVTVQRFRAEQQQQELDFKIQDYALQGRHEADRRRGAREQHPQTLNFEPRGYDH